MQRYTRLSCAIRGYAVDAFDYILKPISYPSTQLPARQNHSHPLQIGSYHLLFL